MAAADRQHVQMISRDRYYIGRGEQNLLAEDMHHEVNYLGQELCSGTHIPASSACAYTQMAPRSGGEVPEPNRPMGWRRQTGSPCRGSAGTATTSASGEVSSSIVPWVTTPMSAPRS